MAGLYIHIPFCHSKCSYCDFFSTPSLSAMTEYIDALLTELSLRRNEIIEPFNTIYIGGGTPSIVPLQLLKKLVEGIGKYLDIDNIDEFTVEANPEDVSEQWCEYVRRLGITRVSMGIQSFDDSQLKFIGRRHTSAQAVKAVDTLRDCGINNISCDLIYGLPNQSFDSWCNSLGKLMSMHLPHFSAYLLSYEPGTRLYMQLQQGRVEEASEDLAHKMYFHLIDVARRNGYEHYEISNFARPSHRAIHNSSYWSNCPYLGLGVSAHSFDGHVRRYNPNKIKDFILAMAKGDTFYVTEEETPQERHNDYIITALRTIGGIDLNKYRKCWGYEQFEHLLTIAQPFLKTGMMHMNNERLSIAEQSMLISDRIMVEFLAD